MANPQDYDKLTNHERYWLLVHLVRDTMHAAHESYAANNAHKPFSAYTMEMQRNILEWLNKKGKTMLPGFRDMPRRVKEQFDDLQNNSGESVESHLF